MRKIIILLVVLGLAGAGFFYWWNNQADVRELNKTLPTGVRIEKSLFGNEYKVVNKIDGYSFKVPPEWEGLEEVEYIPEREELGYVGSSLNFNGKEKGIIGVAIDRFTAGGDMSMDLESWTKLEFDAFELVGDFSKDKIGTLDIVKTQENVHFAGEYIYYLKKDQIIYSLTSPAKGYIEYIITNGQW
ncbi:MAG: hypothetical protein HYT21_02810 [Candidatus Nealsonbacteria bacterium]|nr:hypothetical protein [Candidatus Nealsonbacteria bacterium]